MTVPYSVEEVHALGAIVESGEVEIRITFRGPGSYHISVSPKPGPRNMPACLTHRLKSDYQIMIMGCLRLGRVSITGDGTSYLVTGVRA